MPQSRSILFSLPLHASMQLAQSGLSSSWDWGSSQAESNVSLSAPVLVLPGFPASNDVPSFTSMCCVAGVCVFLCFLSSVLGKASSAGRSLVSLASDVLGASLQHSFPGLSLAPVDCLLLAFLGRAPSEWTCMSKLSCSSCSLPVGCSLPYFASRPAHHSACAYSRQRSQQSCKYPNAQCS